MTRNSSSGVHLREPPRSEFAVHSGVSQNQGYHFKGPYNKEYTILGSILGYPNLRKLPLRDEDLECEFTLALENRNSYAPVRGVVWLYLRLRTPAIHPNIGWRSVRKATKRDAAARRTPTVQGSGFRVQGISKPTTTIHEISP